MLTLHFVFPIVVAFFAVTVVVDAGAGSVEHGLHPARDAIRSPGRRSPSEGRGAGTREPLLLLARVRGQGVGAIPLPGRL